MPSRDELEEWAVAIYGCTFDSIYADARWNLFKIILQHKQNEALKEIAVALRN